MKRAVALLGKDEVDDIVRSQGKIEVSKSGVSVMKRRHVMRPCVSYRLYAQGWAATTRLLSRAPQPNNYVTAARRLRAG